MNHNVLIYTIQLSKHTLLKGTDIRLVDATIKSGDKFFSPEWDWVIKVKKDRSFIPEYTRLYENKMAINYRRDPSKWLDLLSSNVALACYCRPAKFCHRQLLAKYLHKVASHHGIMSRIAGEV